MTRALSQFVFVPRLPAHTKLAIQGLYILLGKQHLTGCITGCAQPISQFAKLSQVTWLISICNGFIVFAWEFSMVLKHHIY
ncbi:hypothetical protein [Nostoc sp. FACHB-133]|uniref:hypothetical protein n=1 Tax=Nostoc sp. FACHB-133 TaxID=2692835 RepID=UPI0016847F5D|nr:hypothetical protein [Nostoc sp. FACHB-133]MBD2527971.1 hypothetical protein [Nostoc sp. FACHB-133]